MTKRGNIIPIGANVYYLEEDSHKLTFETEFKVGVLRPITTKESNSYSKDSIYLHLQNLLEYYKNIGRENSIHVTYIKRTITILKESKSNSFRDYLTSRVHNSVDGYEIETLKFILDLFCTGKIIGINKRNTNPLTKQ